MLHNKGFGYLCNPLFINQEGSPPALTPAQRDAQVLADELLAQKLDKEEMKKHLAWQREQHEQGLVEQPSEEVDSLGYDSVNEIFKGEEEGSSIRTRLRGAASKAASKPLPAETSGNGGSSDSRESSGSESKEKQRALRRVRLIKGANTKRKKAQVKGKPKVQGKPKGETKTQGKAQAKAKPQENRKEKRKAKAIELSDSESSGQDILEASSKVRSKMTAGSRNERHKNEVLVEVVDVRHPLSSLFHPQVDNGLETVIQATASDVGLSDKTKAALLQKAIKKASESLLELGV